MRKFIMTVAVMATAATAMSVAQNTYDPISTPETAICNSRVEIALPENTTAQYVKLNVTKLGLPASTDATGYYFQLNELEIYAGETNVARTANVTASDIMTWQDSWQLAYLTDGQINNGKNLGYTSNKFTDGVNHEVTLTFDLKNSQTIDRIVLYPRQDDFAVSDAIKAANFPSSYTIEVSNDGSNYNSVYEVTDGVAPEYMKPADAVTLFNNVVANLGTLANAEDAYADNANAVNTLETAIKEAKTNASSAISGSDILQLATNLKESGKSFMSSVTLNSGKCFDITYLLTNPNFDTDGITGWTADNQNPGYNQTAKNVEYFEKNFNQHQTIKNMPAGIYMLKAQAFERQGEDNNNAYTAYTSGTATIDTKIYLNNDEQVVRNVMAYSSETALGNEQTESNPNTRDYQDKDGKWHANGMIGAGLYFELGKFDNAVLTNLSENGNITLGIKGDGNKDWSIFDNFRLYYYGENKPVTVDENAEYNNGATDNALVELNRSLKSGKWNTIVLPFDMTEQELKAAFGDDVKVAEYSENSASADAVTVSFKTMNAPTITANVPVLIKSNSQIGTYVVENRTLENVSGNNSKEGTYFSLKGVYAASTTIAEGDYFISGDKLYCSKGETTLKGTRAYIAANTPEAGAKIANFQIDGSDVTAIDGITVNQADDDAVYLISGQRVDKNSLKKGTIYLSRQSKRIYNKK